MEEDIPRLSALSHTLPPVLWLLAKEDGMLPIYGQPTDVGARAAAAVAGPAVAQALEAVVVRGEAVAHHCLVKSHGTPLGGGEQKGAASLEAAGSAAVVAADSSEHMGPSMEVHTYSGIGHTFVMDGTHTELTDGSAAPIVEHVIASTIAWCQRTGSGRAAAAAAPAGHKRPLLPPGMPPG